MWSSSNSRSKQGHEERRGLEEQLNKYRLFLQVLLDNAAQSWPRRKLSAQNWAGNIALQVIIFLRLTTSRGRGERTPGPQWNMRKPVNLAVGIAFDKPCIST